MHGLAATTARTIRTATGRDTALTLVPMQPAELDAYKWLVEDMPFTPCSTGLHGTNVYLPSGKLLGVLLTKGGPVHAEWADDVFENDLVHVGRERTEQIALNYLVDALDGAHRRLAAISRQHAAEGLAAQRERNLAYAALGA